MNLQDKDLFRRSTVLQSRSLAGILIKKCHSHHSYHPITSHETVNMLLVVKLIFGKAPLVVETWYSWTCMNSMRTAECRFSIMNFNMATGLKKRARKLGQKLQAAPHPSFPGDPAHSLSEWQSQISSKAGPHMADLLAHIRYCHKHLQTAMAMHGSTWARCSLFKVL